MGGEDGGWGRVVFVVFPKETPLKCLNNLSPIVRSLFNPFYQSQLWTQVVYF